MLRERNRNKHRKCGQLMSLVLVLAMLVTSFTTFTQALTVRAASAHEVKIHFFNQDNWETVCAWAGDANFTSLEGYEQYQTTWPGAAVEENAEHANWYDLTLVNRVNDGVKFIFNNNNNGAQTSDLFLACEGEYTEAWVIGNHVFTEAPAKWTGEPEGDAPSSDEEKITPEVNDCVQVKCGDAVADMKLYNHGLYEVTQSMSAGATNVELLVNGEKVAEKEISVEAEQDVVIRLQEGQLKTSVTDDFLHTAAWVGSISALSYVENESAYTISDWSPADSNAELDYVGGGIYSHTFHFNELEEAKEIEYKVAFDDAWDYSIGDAGGNAKVTLPAGCDHITITAFEADGMVMDSVSCQNTVKNEGITALQDVSLIGTVRGASDTWNPDALGYEFTQITPELFVFQKRFASDNYEYKVVFNHGIWADGDNKTLALSEEKNVVFLYDATANEVYDSENHTDKIAVALGMKAAAAKMEVVDNPNGTTTFIALAEAGSKVVLHYGEDASKPADKEVELEEVAGKDGVFTSKEIFFGDDAASVIYYYEISNNGKTDRVLDSSNEKVTVSDEDYSNYKKEAFTGRIVTVPGTFPGPSWDASSNVMTYKGNGRYEYQFEAVPAAEYQYKIAFNSWDPENYGKDGVEHGDNLKCFVTEKQNVTIYYNDFSHRAVDSVSYAFVDATLEGSGIPAGTKFVDEDLTGIYQASVRLEAGNYEDVVVAYADGTKSAFGAFSVDTAKTVHFFLDPVTGIKYNDSSDVEVEKAHIQFDSKDIAFKNPYGAVTAGKEVTFAMTTGSDAKTVELYVTGPAKKSVSLEKEGALTDGIQKWSAKVSFDNIGEYHYFFAISNGSAVAIYSDDDGYYGKGVVTDLTNIKPYDLMVYRSDYKTPDWMKNGVIYQIFPDRFFNGDASNDEAQVSSRGEVNYEFIKDWYTLPENPEQEALITEEEYKNTGAWYGDRNWSNEMYGGDLKGIIKRMDYLKAVGVNVIYLNPVFASISSHRYDATDYKMIDPILGTEGDFTELVKVAKENGMHIVLDGVFNHVSDDSIYFDRYYKFLETKTDKIGAYPYWAYVYDYMKENNVSKAVAEDVAKDYFAKNYGIKDFSYTTWFDVYDTPLLDDKKQPVTDKIGLRKGKAVYGYEGWWGYDSMPVIMSTNGSEFQTGNWASEIIEGSNSVTQYWIQKGSNGWRLDVANEVSDETWQHFRQSVKSLDSDAVIIGEIWDDGSKYLMGDMYDSVMNYVFRSAVLDFAMGKDSSQSMMTLERLRERYPQEAFYAMMNLVGSHDTSRVLSFLDGVGDDRNDKTIAGAFPTYEGTSEKAKKSQYLVSFLQFTYAGVPTIYYGDEVGMTGSDDPDDRRAFIWGKGQKDLVTWYAKMAAIRSQYTALRTGAVIPVDLEDEALLSYIRSDKDATLLVIGNNRTEDKQVTIDLKKLGLSEETYTELISLKKVKVSDGMLKITIPAQSGVILTTTERDYAVNEKALAPAYDPSYIVKTEEKKDDESSENKDDNTENKTEETEETPSVQEPTVLKGVTVSLGASTSVETTITENGVTIRVVTNRGEITLNGAKKGIEIKISAGTGILPEGSKISMNSILTGAKAKLVQDKIAGLKDVIAFRAFDISLWNQAEQKIDRLTGNATITVDMPEGLTNGNGNTVVVYRMEENGNLTPLKTTVENGKVTFETNHFSTYVFVEQKAESAPKTGDTLATQAVYLLLVLLLGVAMVRFATKKTR